MMRSAGKTKKMNYNWERAVEGTTRTGHLQQQQQQQQHLAIQLLVGNSLDDCSAAVLCTGQDTTRRGAARRDTDEAAKQTASFSG